MMDLQDTLKMKFDRVEESLLFFRRYLLMIELSTNHKAYNIKSNFELIALNEFIQFIIYCIDVSTIEIELLRKMEKYGFNHPDENLLFNNVLDIIESDVAIRLSDLNYNCGSFTENYNNHTFNAANCGVLCNETISGSELEKILSQIPK